MAEKILEKLFDIKKIPTKFIFVIWLTSLFLLFFPEEFLNKLNLQEFISEFGKYIGISFLISTGFLIVTLITYFSRLISNYRLSKTIRKSILNDINYLNHHEKALLREFFLNNKQTLQLPMDDDTVTGLENKSIIYRASNTGFTYVHGAYFPYSINNIAQKNLSLKMLELPENLTEEDKIWIFENRPKWAKERTKLDNLFNYGH